ncbi:MAG TPA: hypothetical protein VFH78_01915 [Candidatus Thermoplasmatota archaeon]|nr:hypothetical protein [Candidatus Thermoplasmatota archaeon]
MLPRCPSCLGDERLDVFGRCERCRGEWIAPAHTEAAAPGRLPFLRKHIARGPPTERNCPADRAALKAFDIPAPIYEGDLFWGKETPRGETHSIGEGCAQCGGVWMEADQLARGGGRKPVAENLARLAESLA